MRCQNLICRAKRLQAATVYTVCNLAVSLGIFIIFRPKPKARVFVISSHLSDPGRSIGVRGVHACVRACVRVCVCVCEGVCVGYNRQPHKTDGQIE